MIIIGSAVWWGLPIVALIVFCPHLALFLGGVLCILLMFYAAWSLFGWVGVVALLALFFVQYRIERKKHDYYPVLPDPNDPDAHKYDTLTDTQRVHNPVPSEPVEGEGVFGGRS